MSTESVAPVSAGKGVVVLTVLCDNHATYPGVTPVHGLSVLVETPDRRVLFDTGADERTVHNADALGISLAGLDAVVLSHGHYDHVGGLEAVLARTGPVSVYAHEELFGRAYARDVKGEHRYIGPPGDREGYVRLGARFLWARQPIAVGEYVVVSGEMPRHDSYPHTRRHFFRQHGARMVQDLFRDEIAMVVITGELCLTVTGCAHAGVAATVRHARELAAERPYQGLLGGLHLEPLSDQDIRDVALRVHALGLRTLFPCHCTGERGTAILQAAFMGQVTPVAAGTVIEARPDGSFAVHRPPS